MSSTTGPKVNMSGWSPYAKVYDPLKAGSIDGTDLIPHDNAIIRAMSAEYNPPDERTITSNPVLTLFVGRLNLRTSERQLKDEFSQYGQVKSCRLVRDIITGMSRGYGFVEFRKETDAHRAWKAAHGAIFHERQILVEWEFARTMPGWIPRRLGGGLGGKKESGQLRFGGRDRPFKRPLILPTEQTGTSTSVDKEEHHKYENSTADSRDESSRETFSRPERPSFGNNEYEKPTRYDYNTCKDYKNYSEKKFTSDKKYKGYSEGNFNNDSRKYKDWAQEKSANQSYSPEDRKRFKKDSTNHFYEESRYEEEGRHKYRQKAEDRYHQINQNAGSKFKRHNDDIYHEQSKRKCETEYPESYYGNDSSKYKRKADKYYSELGYEQNYRKEFRDNYADYSGYQENEPESNGKHFHHKNYGKSDYHEFNNYYSHKNTGQNVSSQYVREKDVKREKHRTTDYSGAGSSKSENNDAPDLMQSSDKRHKRKYRSSSMSSSSTCSKSSSKRKHKKKHKKRSKQADSSDYESSSYETKTSKKHKKSKKSKKKKSKRASRDNTDTD